MGDQYRIDWRIAQADIVHPFEDLLGRWPAVDQDTTVSITHVGAVASRARRKDSNRCITGKESRHAGGVSRQTIICRSCLHSLSVGMLALRSKLRFPPTNRDDCTHDRSFSLRMKALKGTVNSKGDINVRTVGRTVVSGGIRGVYGIVLSFGLTHQAHALPPLVTAADIAQPGLQAYVKPGEFWVGMPENDARPGLRPLVDLKPRVLPLHLDAFTAVGATCQTTPTDTSSFGGLPLTASVGGDSIHPTIRVELEERPIAESLLGRPATICSVHLVQADEMPGPELIVAWRIEAVRGFTVYRVPESLDPSTANGG